MHNTPFMSTSNVQDVSDVSRVTQQRRDLIEQTIAHLESVEKSNLSKRSEKTINSLRNSTETKDVEIYNLAGEVAKLEEECAKLAAKYDRRKTENLKLKNKVEIWEVERQRLAEMEEEIAKLTAKNDRRKRENRELKRGAEAWEAEKQKLFETMEELRMENKELRTENQQLKDEIAPPVPIAAPAAPDAADGFAEDLVNESDDEGEETREEMKSQKRTYRAIKKLYVDMVPPKDQPAVKRPRCVNYRL